MQNNLVNKHFLFVGARLPVLHALQKLTSNLTILLVSQSFAARQMQAQSQKIHEFRTKAELLELIESIPFDVLVSNGCPYILPISEIRKPHQIFVNCHPSLLPNLKGAHPINGAILYKLPSGATCHLMTDEVDSGAIISQVSVENDAEISLPLLYQMCFLAEKQAFLQAFKRNFDPLNAQELNSRDLTHPYYTRIQSDLELDFSTQSTQEIIQTIKAFGTLSQMAYPKAYPHLKFIDATLIQNTFLDSEFAQYACNDIVLTYDQHLLCKRKDGFLQLTGGGAMNNLPHNLSTPGHTLQTLTTPYIFSSQAYAHALLYTTDSELFTFSYSEGDKHFCNTAIIEPIANTPYFDMSSPYGYSGYYSNSDDERFISRALLVQSKEARSKNIIAEFIRFHPYCQSRSLKNLLDFYNAQKPIIEVSTDSQMRWGCYSSRLRGKLRKSQALLEVRQSTDLESFYSLYAQTMQRNGAEDFYFFPHSYFQALLALPESVMLEAKFEGQIVAMGIFLFDSLCGYYHLGANAPLSLSNNLNGMGALFEKFFEIARQKGLKTCILGGGRGNNEDDSLFLFKKQFATRILSFTIGGKIYDYQAYNTLRAIAEKVGVSPSLFLSYRFAPSITQKATHNNISMTSTGGGQNTT